MIPGRSKRRRRYITADALEAIAYANGAVIVMTRTEATVRVGGLELVAPLAAVEADGDAA